MKHTGTPAYRPTKDCIWNAFRSSGKRHLILTGTRGAGKSTLLQALAQDPSLAPCPKFTTWVKPGAAVCLQKDAGKPLCIGRFDPLAPGKMRKMQPLPALEATAAAWLAACAPAPGDYLLIDEIGYLEAQAPRYLAALEQVMEKKGLVAVLRKEPSLPHYRQLRQRKDVFWVDLDAPAGRGGCIVMASGQGRRFTGGNKLLAPFQGQPLAAWAIRLAGQVFSHCVTVTRQAAVARLSQELGVPAVLHDLPGRNDTIALGIQALPEAACWVFLPADQPLLTAETLTGLALAAANDPDRIWRLESQGQPGSPVAFPARFGPQLLSLPEGQGGSQVIRAHPQALAQLPVSDPWQLQDADTQEALAQLEAVSRQRSAGQI